MQTAIQHATEYSNDISMEDLANDKMRYFAIVKNVEYPAKRHTTSQTAD